MTLDWTTIAIPAGTAVIAAATTLAVVRDRQHRDGVAIGELRADTQALRDSVAKLDGKMTEKCDDLKKDINGVAGKHGSEIQAIKFRVQNLYTATGTPPLTGTGGPI